jgi:hypothetical protein
MSLREHSIPSSSVAQESSRDSLEYEPDAGKYPANSSSSGGPPLLGPRPPTSPLPSPSSARATTRVRENPPRLPSSTPTLTQPLQLTFGVEIECILKYKKEWFDKHKDELPQPEIPLGEAEILYRDPPRFQLQEHMQRNLNAQRQGRYHITAALKESGVQACHPDASDLRKWHVGTDSTLIPTWDEPVAGWYRIPVEIQTPIMKYSQEALNQVRSVLEYLYCEFNNKYESNAKLFVNENCGLHVHVGAQKLGDRNLESTGFPFTVARNLYTAGLFLESQINAIFPPHRLKESHGASIQVVYRKHKDQAHMSRHEIASRIESYKTYGSLVDDLQHVQRRKIAYNLENLDEVLRQCGDGDLGVKQTIEFRQHHGTIDTEEIIHWVEFVCGLIRLSHQAGEAGFPVSFLHRGQDDRFGFLDLLRCLKMDSLIQYYSQPGKLYKHEPELEVKPESGQNAEEAPAASQVPREPEQALRPMLTSDSDIIFTTHSLIN